MRWEISPGHRQTTPLLREEEDAAAAEARRIGGPAAEVVSDPGEGPTTPAGDPGFAAER